jgi:hypothetical protein
VADSHVDGFQQLQRGFALGTSPGAWHHPKNRVVPTPSNPARHAGCEQTGGKLGGEAEADETFIGGEALNMQRGVKARRIHSRGSDSKAIVTAVLQRHGSVTRHGGS